MPWIAASVSRINEAVAANGAACIAFSGGTDSTVLVDLCYRYTKHRLPIVAGPYALQWPETRDFAEEVAARYGAKLHHTPEADRTPAEQWEKQGWPMLGKLQAEKWSKEHRHAARGLKLSCTACCRALMITPKRRYSLNMGYSLQLTGSRGAAEAAIRDKGDNGAPRYIKAHRIWAANPLDGWTLLQRDRYIDLHGVKLHPKRYQGAKSIGCICCGGGGQFTGSTIPILRRLDPEAWRQYIVFDRAGEIILAVKYGLPLEVIQQALAELGGLEAVADSRPWIFDFLREPPLQGYYQPETTDQTKG